MVKIILSLIVLLPGHSASVMKMWSASSTQHALDRAAAVEPFWDLVAQERFRLREHYRVTRKTVDPDLEQEINRRALENTLLRLLGHEDLVYPKP